MSDRDVIAAHRLEASAGWKAGTAGFRAWCTCGWHSDKALPDSEVRSGHKSSVGQSWHDTHVAAALREARTVRSVEGFARLPEGTGVAFFHDDTGELFDSEIHHVGADGLPHGFDEGGLSFWLADMHARVLYCPDEDGVGDE